VNKLLSMKREFPMSKIFDKPLEESMKKLEDAKKRMDSTYDSFRKTLHELPTTGLRQEDIVAIFTKAGEKGKREIRKEFKDAFKLMIKVTPRLTDTKVDVKDVVATEVMKKIYPELSRVLDYTGKLTRERLKEAGILSTRQGKHNAFAGNIAIFSQKAAGEVGSLQGRIESTRSIDGTIKYFVDYYSKSMNRMRKELLAVWTKDKGWKAANIMKFVENIFPVERIIKGLDKNINILKESIVGAASGLVGISAREFKKNFNLGPRFFEQIPTTTLMQTAKGFNAQTGRFGEVPFKTAASGLPFGYNEITGTLGTANVGGVNTPLVKPEQLTKVKDWGELLDKYYFSPLKKLQSLMTTHGTENIAAATGDLGVDLTKKIADLHNVLKNNQVVVQYMAAYVDLNKTLASSNRVLSTNIELEKIRNKTLVETSGLLKGLPTTFVSDLKTSINNIFKLTPQQAVLSRELASPAGTPRPMLTARENIQELSLRRQALNSQIEAVVKTKSAITNIERIAKAFGTVMSPEDIRRRSQAIAMTGNVEQGLPFAELQKQTELQSTQVDLQRQIVMNTAKGPEVMKQVISADVGNFVSGVVNQTYAQENSFFGKDLAETIRTNQERAKKTLEILNKLSEKYSEFRRGGKSIAAEELGKYIGKYTNLFVKQSGGMANALELVSKNPKQPFTSGQLVQRTLGGMNFNTFVERLRGTTTPGRFNQITSSKEFKDLVKINKRQELISLSGGKTWQKFSAFMFMMERQSLLDRNKQLGKLDDSVRTLKEQLKSLDKNSDEFKTLSSTLKKTETQREELKASIGKREMIKTMSLIGAALPEFAKLSGMSPKTAGMLGVAGASAYGGYKLLQKFYPDMKMPKTYEAFDKRLSEIKKDIKESWFPSMKKDVYAARGWLTTKAETTTGYTGKIYKGLAHMFGIKELGDMLRENAKLTGKSTNETIRVAKDMAAVAKGESPKDKKAYEKSKELLKAQKEAIKDANKSASDRTIDRLDRSNTFLADISESAATIADKMAGKAGEARGKVDEATKKMSERRAELRKTAEEARDKQLRSAQYHPIAGLLKAYAVTGLVGFGANITEKHAMNNTLLKEGNKPYKAMANLLKRYPEIGDKLLTDMKANLAPSKLDSIKRELAEKTNVAEILEKRLKRLDVKGALGTKTAQVFKDRLNAINEQIEDLKKEQEKWDKEALSKKIKQLTAEWQKSTGKKKKSLQTEIDDLAKQYHIVLNQDKERKHKAADLQRQVKEVVHVSDVLDVNVFTKGFNDELNNLMSKLNEQLESVNMAIGKSTDVVQRLEIKEQFEKFNRMIENLVKVSKTVLPTELSAKYRTSLTGVSPVPEFNLPPTRYQLSASQRLGSTVPGRRALLAYNQLMARRNVALSDRESIISQRAETGITIGTTKTNIRRLSDTIKELDELISSGKYNKDQLKSLTDQRAEDIKMLMNQKNTLSQLTETYSAATRVLDANRESLNRMNEGLKEFGTLASAVVFEDLVRDVESLSHSFKIATASLYNRDSLEKLRGGSHPEAPVTPTYEMYRGGLSGFKLLHATRYEAELATLKGSGRPITADQLERLKFEKRIAPILYAQSKEDEKLKRQVSFGESIFRRVVEARYNPNASPELQSQLEQLRQQIKTGLEHAGDITKTKSGEYFYKGFAELPKLWSEFNKIDDKLQRKLNKIKYTPITDALSKVSGIFKESFNKSVSITKHIDQNVDRIAKGGLYRESKEEKIKEKKAVGGPINGPGGPTEDKVPIMASPGEYIIKASAARSLGKSTLDFINANGILPRFNTGGEVKRINDIDKSNFNFRGVDLHSIADIVYFTSTKHKENERPVIYATNVAKSLSSYLHGELPKDITFEYSDLTSALRRRNVYMEDMNDPKQKAESDKVTPTSLDIKTPAVLGAEKSLSNRLVSKIYQTKAIQDKLNYNSYAKDEFELKGAKHPSEYPQYRTMPYKSPKKQSTVPTSIEESFINYQRAITEERSYTDRPIFAGGQTRGHGAGGGFEDKTKKPTFFSLLATGADFISSKLGKASTYLTDQAMLAAKKEWEGDLGVVDRLKKIQVQSGKIAAYQLPSIALQALKIIPDLVGTAARVSDYMVFTPYYEKFNDIVSLPSKLKNLDYASMWRVLKKDFSHSLSRGGVEITGSVIAALLSEGMSLASKSAQAAKVLGRAGSFARKFKEARALRKTFKSLGPEEAKLFAKAASKEIEKEYVKSLLRGRSTEALSNLKEIRAAAKSVYRGHLAKKTAGFMWQASTLPFKLGAKSTGLAFKYGFKPMPWALKLAGRTAFEASGLATKGLTKTLINTAKLLPVAARTSSETVGLIRLLRVLKPSQMPMFLTAVKTGNIGSYLSMIDMSVKDVAKVAKAWQRLFQEAGVQIADVSKYTGFNAAKAGKNVFKTAIPRSLKNRGMAGIPSSDILDYGLPKSQYQSGGPIVGPGGPKEDKVPIMASPGEYVVKAESAKKLGKPVLEYINETGEIPELANGGLLRRNVNTGPCPIGGPGYGMGAGSRFAPGGLVSKSYKVAGKNLIKILNKFGIAQTTDPTSKGLKQFHEGVIRAPEADEEVYRKVADFIPLLNLKEKMANDPNAKFSETMAALSGFIAAPELEWMKAANPGAISKYLKPLFRVVGKFAPFIKRIARLSTKAPSLSSESIIKTVLESGRGKVTEAGYEIGKAALKDPKRVFREMAKARKTLKSMIKEAQKAKDFDAAMELATGMQGVREGFEFGKEALAMQRGKLISETSARAAAKSYLREQSLVSKAELSPLPIKSSTAFSKTGTTVPHKTDRMVFGGKEADELIPFRYPSILSTTEEQNLYTITEAMKEAVGDFPEYKFGLGEVETHKKAADYLYRRAFINTRKAAKGAERTLGYYEPPYQKEFFHVSTERPYTGGIHIDKDVLSKSPKIVRKVSGHEPMHLIDTESNYVMAMIDDITKKSSSLADAEQTLAKDLNISLKDARDLMDHVKSLSLFKRKVAETRDLAVKSIRSQSIFKDVFDTKTNLFTTSKLDIDTSDALKRVLTKHNLPSVYSLRNDQEAFAEITSHLNPRDLGDPTSFTQLWLDILRAKKGKVTKNLEKLTGSTKFRKFREEMIKQQVKTLKESGAIESMFAEGGFVNPIKWWIDYFTKSKKPQPKPAPGSDLSAAGAYNPIKWWIDYFTKSKKPQPKPAPGSDLSAAGAYLEELEKQGLAGGGGIDEEFLRKEEKSLGIVLNKERKISEKPLWEKLKGYVFSSKAEQSGINNGLDFSVFRAAEDIKKHKKLNVEALHELFGVKRAGGGSIDEEFLRKEEKSLGIIYNKQQPLMAKIKTFFNIRNKSQSDTDKGMEFSVFRAYDDIKKHKKLNEKVMNELFGGYERGTSYVPQTQLAVVHQGEAIIPAKYNLGGSVTSPSFADGGAINPLRSFVDAGEKIGEAIVKRLENTQLKVEDKTLDAKLVDNKVSLDSEDLISALSDVPTSIEKSTSALADKLKDALANATSTPTTGVGANMSDKIDKFIESTESKLSKFEDIIENNKVNLANVEKTTKDLEVKVEDGLEYKVKDILDREIDELKTKTSKLETLMDSHISKLDSVVDRNIDKSYVESRLQEVSADLKNNDLSILNSRLFIAESNIIQLQQQIDNQTDIMFSNLNRLDLK